MKNDYFRFLILILIVINIAFTSRSSAESGEETWLDPDAWARDHLISGTLRRNENGCKCAETQQEVLATAEDSASLIYFKKFLTLLFNRKNFKYDSTQQIYERSILFTIQSFQMDKLEQLQDPRDLDNILAEILSNARTPYMYRDGQQHTTEESINFKTIILNLLYDILQLTNTSEIRFLLVVAIIVLIAWKCKARFNIGWLTLVFGAMIIYGYLHTYLECNRELEVNQMLEVLKIHEINENAGKTFNLLNYFKEMFYGKDGQISQKEKIKQSAKLSLGFCRPDHVLIIYFNDIFIKYLQVLIEQCTVTLTTLNNNLGFPYNILSGCILIAMIGYAMKLTFKYIISPSAWAKLMYRKEIFKSEQAAINGAVDSQDRISGDNLKLLLNAFNAVPQRDDVASKQLTTSTVSGVEEVTEALEANQEKNSCETDTITTSNGKNNNIDEKPLDEGTNALLEYS